MHSAAIALLLSLACACPLLAAEYVSPKRVLMLDSFAPLSGGAVAFRATLERELGAPVDIHHTTLDSARFGEPQHEAQLVAFLRARYQGKLDLVAPIAAPAAQFVSRNPNLFGATPILVAGISLRRTPPDLPPTTTFVAAKSDPAIHVENVLRLLPDTRRIVMVFGASNFEKFSSSLARENFKRFAGRVEFDWLEGLSMEDIESRVEALTRGSVVVVANLLVDATGLAIDRDEGVRRLRAVSTVPVFGFFESSMGKGIVGGSLYPDITLGVESARVAIRILKGEAPGSIAPVVLENTRPVYDGRELQRFDIPVERLPPGSEVLYRREPLWREYRWHIAGALGLLLLQAALISGLVVQRLRQQRAEAERKRAEAELLHTRAELAHMTRVFALGELSASIAHELNQPLTAILSNAQAAQRFMSEANPTQLHEVREILRDIVQDNKRAGDVIRRVRALVKKEDFEPAPLDMTRTVREVVQLAHSDAMLRHVRVSLEAQPALPPVLGDRVQLQQVVLNLLLNAFDAMKETPTGERSVVIEVERHDERMVTIAVSDNGHGLPEDGLERIFDAFYSTKPNGLGMGLSISRSIVEAHGGKLWAKNNASRGATFCFTVPLAST